MTILALRRRNGAMLNQKCNDIEGIGVLVADIVSHNVVDYRFHDCPVRHDLRVK
jgi:hypothetical protein